jgi:hypothetical protein
MVSQLILVWQVAPAPSTVGPRTEQPIWLLFCRFIGQITPGSELWGLNMPENPVVQFAQGSDLDKAGESLLKLLHKAAGVAEENSQRTLDLAQKLSHQLVAAEQRITDLEAEVERHRDRAQRAEQWLHKVHAEIEERFRPPRTIAR